MSTLQTKSPAETGDSRRGFRAGTSLNRILQPNKPLVKREQAVPVRTVDGQVVGFVLGGVLRKIVKGSRHMLRKPLCWALDVVAVDTAERLGACQVVIVDSDSSTTYMASISTVRSRGFVIDRGYGAQWALPLRWWKTNTGQVTEQLSLDL